MFFWLLLYHMEQRRAFKVDGWIDVKWHRQKEMAKRLANRAKEERTFKKFSIIFLSSSKYAVQI